VTRLTPPAYGENMQIQKVKQTIPNFIVETLIAGNFADFTVTNKIQWIYIDNPKDSALTAAINLF
jgi:hypothetical protein